MKRASSFTKTTLKKATCHRRNYTNKLRLLVFSPVASVIQKVQRWRALIYKMIAKQRAKREQTHPVCSHAVEKYEKMESVNPHNDYKTTSKKSQINRNQTCV